MEGEWNRLTQMVAASASGGARLALWLEPGANAKRSGRDAAPFRMFSVVAQRLMTTLPRAWPSRMYWMAAGVWLSG